MAPGHREPSLGIWCLSVRRAVTCHGRIRHLPLRWGRLGTGGRGLLGVDCSSTSEDCWIAVGSELNRHAAVSFDGDLSPALQVLDSRLSEVT